VTADRRLALQACTGAEAAALQAEVGRLQEALLAGELAAIRLRTDAAGAETLVPRMGTVAQLTTQAACQIGAAMGCGCPCT